MRITANYALHLPRCWASPDMAWALASNALASAVWGLTSVNKETQIEWAWNRENHDQGSTQTTVFYWGFSNSSHEIASWELHVPNHGVTREMSLNPSYFLTVSCESWTSNFTFTRRRNIQLPSTRVWKRLNETAHAKCWAYIVPSHGKFLLNISYYYFLLSFKAKLQLQL